MVGCRGDMVKVCACGGGAEWFDGSDGGVSVVSVAEGSEGCGKASGEGWTPRG